MKGFATLYAAALAAGLAGCADGPTAPVRLAPPQRGNLVIQICDVFLDPNCNPAADVAVQELVNSLTAEINALRISSVLKSRLIAYVDQIPTRLDALTPEQKQLAIGQVNALIGFVQFLTPRFIPAADANRIITIANQLVRALSY